MAQDNQQRKCKNEQRLQVSPTSTKISIKQKVTNPKKTLLKINRGIDDPKEIVVQRRFGEGSKPLFAREDIRVNSSPTREKLPIEKYRRNSSNSDESDSRFKGKRRSNSRTFPNESPSTKIPHCSDEHSKSLERKQIPKASSSKKGKSQSPKKQCNSEKIPYFLDTKREEDRIREKYGSSSSTKTSKTHPKSKERRRSRSRSRSRSHSHSHSPYRRSRDRNRRSSSDNRSRRHSRSYRSPSGERRRNSHRKERRHSRSRTRSSSRSRAHIHSSRTNYIEPRTQQFIPVMPMTYPFHAAWMPPVLRYPPMYIPRPIVPPIPALPLPPRPRPYMFPRFRYMRSNYRPRRPN